MKDRAVCKNCYYKKKRKNTINNTLIQSQQPKTDNVYNINSNRTFIIGFSKCGKSYLKKYVLLQKQEPICIITKSVNQSPNIKAQTSDEIQLLEKYENSNVVFDNMMLSKQENNIDLFSQEDAIIILT